MKTEDLVLYQGVFDEALTSDLGIEITFDAGDFASLKQALYRARSALLKEGLDQYKRISLTTPPSNAETTLWITKNVSST